MAGYFDEVIQAGDYQVGVTITTGYDGKPIVGIRCDTNARVYVEHVPVWEHGRKV